MTPRRSWVDPIKAAVPRWWPSWLMPTSWREEAQRQLTAPSSRIKIYRTGAGLHLVGSLPSKMRRDLGPNQTARQAFAAMQAAAAREGIVFRFGSNYRTIAHQARLYAQSDGKGKWTAKPGHSEHHTGLAFDIATTGYRSGRRGNFDDSPAYRWLKENGYRFGFVQSMSHESWHWRYDPQAVREATAPA